MTKITIFKKNIKGILIKLTKPLKVFANNFSYLQQIIPITKMVTNHL